MISRESIYTGDIKGIKSMKFVVPERPTVSWGRHARRNDTLDKKLEGHMESTTSCPAF